LPALGIEPDAGIPIFSVNATQTHEAVQVLIALIEQYQRLTQSHAKAG